MPASTSINASAIPIFSVGENVPDVVTPTLVSPSSTLNSGRSTPRPTARRPRSSRGGPASFSAQQRVAAEECVLLPADRPAASGLQRRDVGGELMTMQRITHLGAQRVA